MHTKLKSEFEFFSIFSATKHEQHPTFRNSSDKDFIPHSLLVNMNEAHKEPTALRDFY